MLQTVRKIGPVLDLFTADRADWGVTEVAAALDIPRSSAHALLASLADVGLLRSGGRGRYRIGWRVVELVESLHGNLDLRSLARPVLRELVTRFGETVHLAVWERGKALYVERVTGNHHVNVIGVRVGARVEPHCCATGKVLLAYRDPNELRRYLGSPRLARMTANSVTDPALLRDQLQGIRTAGCAFDAGEAVAEVHCVAAPVKDDFGAVVAALSITAPASRFLPRVPELRRAVLAGAHEISASIASDAPRRAAARS